MNVYENEHEQVEALKAWWKRNGKLVIGTVIVAVAISFGWRYWQENHVRKLTEASVLYERMLISIANHDNTSFKQVADQLERDYSRTVYAGLAGLFSAKNAADEGKFDVALQQLQQVMKQGKTASVRQIARVRAARIYVSQKQPQQALDILQKVDDAGFQSAIDVVKGDAYVALNQPESARKAYQSALTEAPATDPMHSVIQMKLQSLPSSS